jgi:hypothetical protein
MTEPIDIAAFRRQRLKLTPEEKRFDDFVHELREWPVPTLIEALIAARDVHELAVIATGLNELVIWCASAPPAADGEAAP